MNTMPPNKIPSRTYNTPQSRGAGNDSPGANSLHLRPRSNRNKSRRSTAIRPVVRLQLPLVRHQPPRTIAPLNVVAPLHHPHQRDAHERQANGAGCARRAEESSRLQCRGERGRSGRLSATELVVDPADGEHSEAHHGAGGVAPGQHVDCQYCAGECSRSAFKTTNSPDSVSSEDPLTSRMRAPTSESAFVTKQDSPD
ncbi:hypothetical protein CT0861_11852 [Colletotrichum tofieldiae]|uniref:Uncharacterized protein n=1 Tax=Colletotrichum tofieldiae TaxID=708197 RepID=A0A166XK31_9PEZI|nr:hypothetical protein CT0861_11852 [Colletotrichum tofieldiae]